MAISINRFFFFGFMPSPSCGFLNAATRMRLVAVRILSIGVVVAYVREQQQQQQEEDEERKQQHQTLFPCACASAHFLHLHIYIFSSCFFIFIIIHKTSSSGLASSALRFVAVETATNASSRHDGAHSNRRTHASSSVARIVSIISIFYFF